LFLLCSLSAVSDAVHSPESASETMAERHARMLADAAAHAHRIVCARGQEAVEAQTQDQRAQAERAFNDAARTMRAAILLEARLARGLEAAFRAERDAALERRRRLVVFHLRRQIRRAEAAAGQRNPAWGSDLHERLDADLVGADLLDAPLDEVIARLRRRLGLPQTDLPLAVAPDDPTDEPQAARFRAPPRDPYTPVLPPVMIPANTHSAPVLSSA
jgi:hypothetical protein